MKVKIDLGQFLRQEKKFLPLVEIEATVIQFVAGNRPSLIALLDPEQGQIPFSLVCGQLVVSCNHGYVLSIEYADAAVIRFASDVLWHGRQKEQFIDSGHCVVARGCFFRGSRKKLEEYGVSVVVGVRHPF